MADVELVIKIPEHCLKELKCVELNESNEGAVFHAIKCILNGIPLDKHEKEIIEEVTESLWGKPPYRDLLNAISKEITSLPSELTEDGRRLIRRGDVLRIIEQYRGKEDGSM